MEILLKFACKQFAEAVALIGNDIDNNEAIFPADIYSEQIEESKTAALVNLFKDGLHWSNKV